MELENITELTVIGVGASAGGLEALQDLLKYLPAKLHNVAFIVAQHLSPTYKSRMVELLRKNTTWKIVEAEQGATLDSNTMYITPPDTEIEIVHKKIKLSKSIHSPRPKPSVDTLFESLAMNYQNKSIGIILSGTGTDGTIGAKAIKKTGGYIIAQEPNTAKYDGMPMSVIESGNVDWVLSTEYMGEEIYHLLQEPKNLSIRYNQEENITTALQKVFAILTQRTGTDFSNYKPTTILRRLEKRIVATKTKNIEEYLLFLESNPQEIDTLFDTILIGVTSFFRDKEAFAKLEEYLAKVVQNKRKNDAIRIWVAGSATGEEAYSIAIILNKLLHQRQKDYSIQIFATDIDERAIAKARKAIYPAQSLIDVPTEIIEQYFLRKGNDYELIKTIKSMVLFSKHDLSKNPPFLKLDLITCRNLLIYFGTNLQKQIIPIFHYALNPNAYLFLGKSETVGHFNNLFETVDAKAKIFQQKRTNKASSIKISNFKPVKYNLPIANNTKIATGTDISLETLAKETLFQQFESPYTIVNDIGDVQELRGNINKYLSLPQGVLQTNLAKLILPDLQIEFRAVFSKATQNKETTKSRIRKIHTENSVQYVRMVIAPLLFTEKLGEFYLVIFEELNLSELEDVLPNLLSTTDLMQNFDANTSQNQRIIELEQELAVTKEHLQSFIEELETSNEELQSLNEELQSTNEELQASNEELETGNEELQSTNEEVQIAYEELKTANDELEKTDNLLKISETNLLALLNNSLKGSCLIDRNYKILLHNKKFSKLFTHISDKNIATTNFLIDYISPIHLAPFYENLSVVFTTKTAHNFDYQFIANNKKFYYIINFTPVLDSKGEVKNISIGVLDTSNLQELDIKLKSSEKLLSSVFDVAAIGIAVIDEEGYYAKINQEYCKIYGYVYEELIHKHFTIVMPDIHHASVSALHKDFLAGKVSMQGEWQVKRKTGEVIYVEVQNALLTQIDGTKFRVVSVKDITESKKQKNLLEKTQEAGKIGGWYLDLVTGQNTWTEEVYRIYEAPADYNVNVDNGLLRYEVEDREILEKALQAAINENKSYHLDLRFISLLNTKKWVHVTCNPVAADGKVVKLYGTIQDITEQKETNNRLRESENRFRIMADAAPVLIWLSDTSKECFYFNQQWLNFRGKTLEHEVGNGWVDGVHPDDLTYCWETYSQAFDQHLKFSMVYRLCNANNEYRWLLDNGVPRYLEDGTFVGYIGSCVDITEQKEAENQLRESQKMYKILAENSVDVVYTLDNAMKMNFISPSIFRLTGYSPEEFKAMPFDKMLPPESLKIMWQKHAERMQAEATDTNNKEIFVTMEIEQIRKDGQRIWTETVTTRLYDENNEKIGYLGVTRDVTMRRQAENKLRESQRKYELLANNLHDVIFTTDENIKFTFITPSILQMTGYTVQEFMELNPQDYLTAEGLALIYKNHIERTKIETENPETSKYLASTLELQYVCKDKTLLWVEVLTSRLYDEQDKSIGFVGIIRDISLRKQQENELKKLSLVASKTNNAIIITDKDRLVEWINDGFTRTTGYTLEDCQGKTLKFLQGAETKPEDIMAISQNLISKKPFTQEILNYTKTGEKYWVNLNITPILNENGEVEKYIGIQNDITSKKIAEEQLQNYANQQKKLTEDLTQQNNDLRQFSYILSHNIRSYVANILGIVNLMNIDDYDKNELEEYLQMLEQATNGLDSVIKDLNDILDVRRPFNKRIEKIELLPMLAEITDTLQNQIVECQANIHYDLQVTELLSVKPYLQSVLYNLISNSIKYRNIEKPLQVRISSKIVADKIVIQVQDNGLGIDLVAQKDNIFSLYKRFHLHTSGKGLGLFMVKTQIEAMGGTIEVESKVEEGSKFSVILPLETKVL
jgi:two-component system CheB/CheR fusion protein